MGQEVGPLYVASMFRVQGRELAGGLLLLLITQGPAALPSLGCLVAVAHEVFQGQGAICEGTLAGYARPSSPFLSLGRLHSPLRHPRCLHGPSSCPVLPPIGRRAQGGCGGSGCL